VAVNESLEALSPESAADPETLPGPGPPASSRGREGSPTIVGVTPLSTRMAHKLCLEEAAALESPVCFSSPTPLRRRLQYGGVPGAAGGPDPGPGASTGPDAVILVD
jgi:hypothetical protein